MTEAELIIQEYKQILEVAKTLSSDMAVYVGEGETFIVLYKPSPDLKKSLSDYDYTEGSDSILGAVTTRWNDSYQVTEIDSIFAKSGYGPVLSQIMMSYYKKDGIAMNRSPHYVTDAAKKLWKGFFDGAGSDLVTTEEINSEVPHHEEDYLNHKFFIKKPLRLSKQLSNHKKFIGKDPYGEMTTAFEEFADYLLTGRMNDIYNFQ
jgi:hypothetical protein